MDTSETCFSLQWRDNCHSDSEDSNPHEDLSSSSDSEDALLPSPAISPSPSSSPRGTSVATAAVAFSNMLINTTSTSQSNSDKPAFIPRGYQLELYRRAINENIIICVETGAGKTNISALLIKHMLEQVDAKIVSNPKTPRIVIFLVHRVPLVQQQADVIQNFIPEKFLVGCYHGDCGVDNWSPERWAANIKEQSVLVMTAQIFLNLLRHALICMDEISLLVVDEAHHATKSHPYCRIFLEFYHSIPSSAQRPRVFGMTATPVKAKNASLKHAKCLVAVSKLEATMDSTVVTVSTNAQDEVEALVPKPNEYIVSYIPSSENSFTVGNAAEEAIDRDVLEHVLNNVPSNADSQQPRPRGLLPITEMDLLSRLNDKIGFVAAKDIAIRFCDQRRINPNNTLKILVKQNENLDPSRAGVSDKAFRLLDVLFFEYIRCQTELAKKQEMTSTSEGDDMVQDDEKFRTIVFTHERVSALALCNLINQVFGKHKCSELTAFPVIGTTSQSVSLVRISQSSMTKTIDAFKEGQFGILVATNVAEEGIDIPACRLVVTFDPPSSAAAYVQGRGRARRRGAHYISLAAAGTDVDYNILLRSREGARIMTDVSRGAYVTEETRRAMRSTVISNVEMSEGLQREKTLFSRTTTARVPASDAPNLLAKYCNIKRQLMCVEDMEEPKYEVIADRKMFRATVTLDKRIPIDGGFCTSPQLNQQHAKRIAALDAYRKLYEIGEVNEYLLPKKGSRSNRVLEVAGPIGPARSRRNKGALDAMVEVQKKSSKKNRPAVESKASKKHKRMRVCEIAHPLAEPSCSSPLGNSSSGTKEDVEDGFESDEDNPEIIVLDEDDASDSEARRRAKAKKRRRLKKDSDRLKNIMDVDENLDDNNKQKFKKNMFVYKIELMSQLHTQQWSSRSSTSTFSLVLHYKIRTEDLHAVECPSGKPLLMLTECGKLPWNDHLDDKAYRYARAIQICLMGKTPGSDKALEMEDYYRTGDYRRPVFYLLPLKTNRDTGSQLEIDWHTVDNLLSYGWRCGPLQKHEMVGPEGMENVLVCSLHERLERVYISNKLNPHLKPTSSSTGYIQSFPTFKEYYERKHQVIVKNADQHLLPGHSLRETLSGNTDHVFMLVPEFIRVVPLDPLACYVASVLPFWQTFMALRDCWNRNGIKPIRFLEFARALQPNVNNVCNGNADLCYERSEFLGDSVLKVINSLVRYVEHGAKAEGDEGDLSDARDIEVSNGYLADIAVKMQLHNCVAYSGIAPKIKSWPWYWGASERKPLNVSEKVLADCLEALIGAHYQSGGFVSACIFLERHGLLPGACQTLGIIVNRDVNCAETINLSAAKDDGGLVIDVPKIAADDRRHESPEIAKIEEKIGYTFREKRHLVIALTHGSWGFGNCASYQKYEYLGDAIVGFLLLSHFHDVYPHLGPNELTKLRGPALSNNLFARVIVGLGIHRMFWYSSGSMERDIDETATAILNEEGDDDDICAKIKVPKVLGDLLEAIIGAIAVDQGMRLDVVRKVSLQLLQEQLDRFANPMRFKDNVVSKLLLVVQKHFHTCPDYVFLDQADDEEKKCQVWIGMERKLGEGSGPTRAIARRNATRAALKELGVNTGGTVLAKDHDKRAACAVTNLHADGAKEGAPSPGTDIPVDIIVDDQRSIMVYDQGC